MLATIILARLDSQRFPQKALEAKINGVGLLEHIINALSKDKFFVPILATTNRSVDDPLADLANKCGIKVFRGDLENIAKRVSDCLKFYDIKYFARINGDSPFVQLDLLKKGYDLVKKNDYDFVTNLYPRSFPYGVSVEIFKSDVFIENMEKNTNPHYLENITSFFYDNISEFKYGNISLGENINHQNIILTVDTREDLERIQKMIELDKDIFKKNIDEVITVYKKVN